LYIKLEFFGERFFLGKNNNVDAAMGHFLKADVVMAGLARKYAVRPSRRPTENRFEYLAHTILYQQLATKAAAAISKRFADLFTGRKGNDGRNGSKVFPEPARVLKVPDDKLRAVGISWAKVKYIKDLAHKVHHKEVRLDHLHTLTDEEVIAELTKVKGIGRWTAEMFLMSALARPDIFSFGDLGLQTAIKKAYGLRKLPSRRTMLILSKKWSPYRTYAARVLWASLDNE
jgi:DNA-3-methyladenine glycosylase II